MQQYVLALDQGTSARDLFDHGGRLCDSLLATRARAVKCVGGRHPA